MLASWLKLPGNSPAPVTDTYPYLVFRLTWSQSHPGTLPKDLPVLGTPAPGQGLHMKRPHLRMTETVTFTWMPVFLAARERPSQIETDSSHPVTATAEFSRSVANSGTVASSALAVCPPWQTFSE